MRQFEAMYRYQVLIMTILLSACAAKQSNQPAYSPTYVPTPYVAYRSVNPRADYPPISYVDLMRFEYNCGQRLEQINFLEDQLRKKTFYRVDGVEGNDFLDRISKKYFALARYRIWALRLSCRGSKVDQSTQISLMQKAMPTQMPEPYERCYEEAIFESSVKAEGSGASSDTSVSKHRKICTNFPLLSDSKIIRIGDVVDPERELEKNIPYIPNLRKFEGNIYQLVSKTEMHLGGVTRFTVVLLWVSNKGWVVVDKF